MSTAGLGHVEVFDAGGSVEVVETLTCAHCQRIYRKPGPKDEVGFCHMCWKPVCLGCGGSDKCVPFERKLQEVESRDRLMRSCGIG